ncbi:MAG: biotin transporter BioY [Eubacteriales bacterium]|nr:biotin transporter BioY [Eubacteriales bacterium]
MTTKRMTRIALCAALLAPCAWLSVPTQPPFTMQTFGVFLTLLLLGAKDGTIAIGLYILLGALGVPVFSGFNGGMGALMGPTGGYIVGFLLMCLIFGLLCGKGAGLWLKALALLLGLAVCYAFGTLWFVKVYGDMKGPISTLSALSMCVFPFIVPDLAKLALALWAGKRLEKYSNK